MGLANNVPGWGAHGEEGMPRSFVARPGAHVAALIRRLLSAEGGVCTRKVRGGQLRREWNGKDGAEISTASNQRHPAKIPRLRAQELRSWIGSRGSDEEII